MPRLLVKSSEVPAVAYELKLGLNRLGRSSRNDFQIDHPTVSAMHCQITWLNDGVLVRDCGSTNGTYIQGEPVKEAPLLHGQTLHVGEVECEFDFADVNIHVPPIPVPEVPHPVKLPDGSWACPNHSDTPAVYRCTHCQQLLCEECVHKLRRVGGRQLLLCPLCSQHCEVIGKRRRKRYSFLEVLQKTLKMTFQRKPKPPAPEP
jgi:hypothetical protein